MSPIDPYLGAQAPAQDFIRTFLDREIPAGLLFYAPFLPQTGNQAWAADKRIVVPTVETVDADGSYFAKDGLIRRARANALRMEGLGALLEGAKTNICLRSEQLDIDGAGTPWTHGNSSVSANVTTAPDGVASADKLVEDNTNNIHYVLQAFGAGNRTWSIFAKAAERTWLVLSTGVGTFRYFDLVNGVLGGGVAPVDSGIERYPNGWFRCWVMDNGAGNISAWLATGDGVSTYLGDGTSGAYLWGGQYEVAPHPSSYVPTVAAGVARAADDIQYASAGHIIPATGTIFLAITPEAASDIITAFAVFFDTRDAGNNNGINIFQDPTPNRLTYFVRSGGATVASINSLAILNWKQTYIVACTWAVNDFRLYLDGVLQGSDVAGAAPVSHTAIYVGRYAVGAGLEAYANLAHLTIFNRAMSTAEIEQRSHFFRNQMARAS